MRLLLPHAKAYFLQHVRQPGFVIPTILMPSLIFLLFGLSNSDTKEKANFLYGSFSAYAVIGVVFFQFALGTANERKHSWNQWLRLLPAPNSVIFAARAIVIISFSVITTAILFGTMSLSTEVDLTAKQHLLHFGLLIVGALPFAALGILFGMLFSPTSVVPVGNIFYLTFSYAGGLWFPPNMLPQKVADLSKLLPSRHYGELIWNNIQNKSLPLESAGILAIWMLCALVIFSLMFSKSMERAEYGTA